MKRLERQRQFFRCILLATGSFRLPLSTLRESHLSRGGQISLQTTALHFEAAGPAVRTPLEVGFRLGTRRNLRGDRARGSFVRREGTITLFERYFLVRFDYYAFVGGNCTNMRVEKTFGAEGEDRQRLQSADRRMRNREQIWKRVKLYLPPLFAHLWYLFQTFCSLYTMQMLS